jgi:hypothetical protein
MILTDGDPRTVIEHGSIFDAAKLAKSVGFRN